MRYNVTCPKCKERLTIPDHALWPNGGPEYPDPSAPDSCAECGISLQVIDADTDKIRAVLWFDPELLDAIAGLLMQYGVIHSNNTVEVEPVSAVEQAVDILKRAGWAEEIEVGPAVGARFWRRTVLKFRNDLWLAASRRMREAGK